MKRELVKNISNILSALMLKTRLIKSFPRRSLSGMLSSAKRKKGYKVEVKENSMFHTVKHNQIEVVRISMTSKSGGKLITQIYLLL